MDLFVGSHGGRGGRVPGVGGAALGALGQGQHEHGPEVAGQETQQLAAEGGRAGLARVVAEQLEPVRLVAAFGLGQGQQDGAFFAVAVLGEVAVDGGFGAFVGEVLAPALDVRRGRAAAGLRRRGCGVAAAGGRRCGVDRSDFAC